MRPEFFIPIAIVFIVVGLPVLCGTLIKLAKIIKGEPTDCGSSKKKKNNNTETDKHEAEIVQEINQLVTRLEKRIDALETIVLDHNKR